MTVLDKSVTFWFHSAPQQDASLVAMFRINNLAFFSRLVTRSKIDEFGRNL